MLTTLLAGLFMIGLLVVVHELGHALVARFFGVEVPVFALAGVSWIRISAQIYVDMQDIQRLGEAVRSMIE